MSTLSPQVISRVLQVPLRKPDHTPAFVYDNSLDDLIAGMSNRRWDEFETFPPMATRVYYAISGSCVLGNNPEFDDIPLLLTVAETTKHPDLRRKASTALQLYLADCSGVDASLKPRVREVLESMKGHHEPQRYS